jgi:glycosyltransferase involved in cell wall biosynthesis
VVTDAGDSALIVGDCGEVVPTQRPEALAQAWRGMLEAGEEVRRKRGQAGRARVEQHFSLHAVVAQYEQLYRDLAPCAA